ncbi:General transcription factor IIF subunit 2 [Lamellibrachia satsuma]|nr:General transcription factor IIF subunit 2 [Lamellibrachia satsuma]
MDAIEKAHEAKDLDLSGAARGVWLVKVPKYLAEEWKNAPPNADVGKLSITTASTPGGKPEVVFSLDETSSKTTTAGGGVTSSKPAVPKYHKFVLTGIVNQNLYVLATEMSEGPNQEQIPENVSIEGKVIQRAECRPLGDPIYMKLKRTQIEQSNRPQKEVKQLKNAVLNYKPVSVHTVNKAYEDKKKEEGKKSRLDKERVMDMLFSAFEKHQYYNVKDLVRITKQPITYLKEILKEICLYNMKAPHKNMWELKPEFRHYKEPM